MSLHSMTCRILMLARPAVLKLKLSNMRTLLHNDGMAFTCGPLFAFTTMNYFKIGTFCISHMHKDVRCVKMHCYWYLPTALTVSSRYTTNTQSIIKHMVDFLYHALNKVVKFFQWPYAIFVHKRFLIFRPT